MNDPIDNRRALARAIIALGRARDRHSLDPQLPELDRALRDFGRGGPAPFDDAWSSSQGLPDSGREALLGLLRSFDGPNAAIRLGAAVGSELEGYELEYESDGSPGTAFALPMGSEWFLAPGPVGREDIEAALDAFQRHFDLFVVPLLARRGHEPRAILRARSALRPVRALWPGEVDPHERAYAMPLVFVIHNPIADGRRFYCAFDPFSGEAEPYDFA